MTEKNLMDILQHPLVTEKSTVYGEQGKYSFRVHPKATKGDVKLAVEKAFNVKVVSVNTMNVRGRLKRVRFQPGYTAAWKKAVVTLKKGQKIDLTP